MDRFITTLARTLALSILTSLVGCDELEGGDADDLELRDGLTGGTGTLSLPVFGNPAPISFSVPLQVPKKYSPKLDLVLPLGLPPPTNPSYVWTPDPTGAPGILADAAGQHPYSGDVLLAEPSACQSFLAIHPTNVPVTNSLSSCAAVETGCCDYVCSLFQGEPHVQNGQNQVVGITDGDLDTNGVIKNAYVPDQLEWDDEEENGGYSEREVVCGCACDPVLVIIDP